MRKRLLLAIFWIISIPVWAQNPNATITGRILDPTKAVISGATVEAINTDTSTIHTTKTNDQGLFTMESLPPGNYRIEVSKEGFKRVVKPDVMLHVQDVIALNFDMSLGSTRESITVEGGAPLVNTQDASVSTVVDRNFAENLPVNGRSFQTLVQLTPGVVVTTSNVRDNGQFSTNGQRADANYWMVDGVSANAGIGVNANGNPGNGLAGSVNSFSAFGGTNSLVSMDAMQEFRIQTSVYAPEFGRTPGAQISITTRSGTNRFHGTAFDYLRNDALDSSDWFNGFTNKPPLPKARERQNDFGGTFSGPVFKNHAFFFFSYEGLRLRLPQTAITTVPDLAARQNAVAAMQPFLRAFPLPNGPDNPSTGVAQLNASYSDPASLDAYSLRIDQKINDGISIFGRYNYSPSNIVQRGGGGVVSLSTLSSTKIGVQTATLGATWNISPGALNDFRFNYSRTEASNKYFLDGFNGASPLTTPPLPGPFSERDSTFRFAIQSLKQGQLDLGKFQQNLQQQINFVDSVFLQQSVHSIKLGVDFRRLSPTDSPSVYSQLALFGTVPAAEAGRLLRSNIASALDVTFLFRNLGSYAQDTWRIAPRLTMTYGFRWDIDFCPESLKGPGFPAVAGWNLQNLSNLALAPAGTKPFATSYGNVAPRIGLAYQLFEDPNWQTVARGGFGIFYDLVTSEAGNSIALGNYPFGASITKSGGVFPLDSASAAPVPIVSTNISSAGSGQLLGFDPHLKAPYTFQWNVALEQSLGKEQMFSLSYIGAAGKRLLQTLFAFSLNSNIRAAQLVTNASTSNYDALQLQFQRRLSRSVQALASYSWAHSIDTGSAASIGVKSNDLVASAGPKANRAVSDFDIRHVFSLGATYNIPTAKTNAFARAVFGGWSLESLVQARSAAPVDTSDAKFAFFSGYVFGDIRPDIVSGQSLYLLGPQYPGGKAFNPAAFKDPPIQRGFPIRQGNVPRNFLRGFGAADWDFGIHREFPVRESLRLQFRAEMFNVLNHPNFGQPSGQFGISGFGLASQTLNQSLAGSGSLGAGGFSPLYQIGGPRSIQLALKLSF